MTLSGLYRGRDMDLKARDGNEEGAVGNSLLLCKYLSKVELRMAKLTQLILSSFYSL
ncbi:hypothetical protein SAMN05443144_102147 [Fodinibius roseus]|uniref:Uncharacterized protein n=1 Tax=Fodinibius roseus TaxID=1194090 RepID=A0A1M4UXD3_9BACT|nr:hypothetical protein SAMN05443144_102147 [Fodinibius roseus]